MPEQTNGATEGFDYLDIDETGERRLPVAASVDHLPATTDVPLPVTCWVGSTGMYRMDTMGEWTLVYALDHPTALPAPQTVRPDAPPPAEPSLFSY